MPITLRAMALRLTYCFARSSISDKKLLEQNVYQYLNQTFCKKYCMALWLVGLQLRVYLRPHSKAIRTA